MRSLTLFVGLISAFVFVATLSSLGAEATPLSVSSVPQVIDTIPVGGSPIGVAVNEKTNRIYVTNFLSNTISVIDGATNTVIKTIDAEAEAPCAAAVNSATNKIYVANCNAGLVTVIDGENHTFVTSIPVGPNTKGIAVNSVTNRIYVTTEGPYDLEVIDGNVDEVIHNIDQPDYGGASAVAVNEATNHVYVRMYHSVHVLDGSTNNFFAVVTGLASHTDARYLIDVNPVTNMVYALNDYFEGPLYIIDGESNTLEETLAVPPAGPGLPSYPQAVSVNSRANSVFVSDYRGRVSVLDAANNAFLPDQTLVPGNLTGIAVNSVNNRVYVASPGTNEVVVLGYGACEDSEWITEYYSNPELQGSPVHTGCSPAIDFYWGAGSPSEDVPSDYFSARYVRTIDVPEDGWYRFRAFMDDGLRLYVDGELVIDSWFARGFEENTVTLELEQGRHQTVVEYLEVDGEALAHFDWYLCSTGESDCSINTASMYQTEYLDSPIPETCSTEPNQTIARWGCLITSYAMALWNLGISVTPDELNHLLSEEDGAYEATCNANLQGPGYITKVILDNYNVRLNWIPVRTLDQTKAAIRNGHPVIMHSALRGHFFLGVDVASLDGAETIGIKDPHHSWSCRAIQDTDNPPPPVESELLCSGPTLQHEITIQGRYPDASPRLYLERSTEPGTPSIQFRVEGAEILLIDDQGNLVGFDNAGGQPVFDIENAFYYDSAITPPGETSDGVIERTLFIPDNASQHYTLRVISISAGSTTANLNGFTIVGTGFDAELNPSTATVSGTIPSGGFLEYEVTFHAGEVLEIMATTGNLVYLPLLVR